MAKNYGKEFEADIKQSSNEQKIFFYRIKDQHIPHQIRHLVSTSYNDFDCFLYFKPNLYAIELKSTQGTALSFEESIVKEHQLEKLQEASEYTGIIAGLMINFRSKGNRTFFIEITEYLKYKDIAQNSLQHNYKGKVNKSSISFSICEEIGIEVKNELKRTHYRYFMQDFVDKTRDMYGKIKRKKKVDKELILSLERSYIENSKDGSKLSKWSEENIPQIFDIIKGL